MTNNYYPNQQYNPFGANANFNYSYAAPRPQAKNTQPLTQEEINSLRRNNDSFDMKVSQEDLWRASCTHKEKNGNSALIQNPDGSYTCTICHETFNMCDFAKEEVIDTVKKMDDILQTIKTIYLDSPDEFASKFFQMIALINKIPGVWDRAINNFAMYEGTIDGGVNRINNPGYSGFAAVQSLLTNPYSGFGAQPAYGYAPGYPQQPAYNGYGYAAPVQNVDPNYNPMAYGMPQQPQPQQAPMAPAPGVMPGMAQPAPSQPQMAPTPTAQAPVNAAPVNTQGEVQQQATFNV